MLTRRNLLLILLGLVLVWPAAAQDNAIEDIVTITVDAGFDGRYRSDQWLPLRVRVQNNGVDVTGRLTVRPESSGDVVTNAFSTPIDLPSGSDKAAFLYIQARAFADGAVVELLDNADVRVGSQTFRLNSMDAQDTLHVVISDTDASTLVLNDLAPGGFASVPVRWTADNVPTYAASLQAVDTLLLYNLDSNLLTTAQRCAITDWTALGGHLIVVGGPNWQQTAAAFTDVLPLTPDETETLPDLSPLAAYAGLNDLDAAQTVIAVGSVRDEATILAATDEDVPLLVRGRLGAGTVDYLAADPGLEPLVSWDGTSDFWQQMLISAAPQPGWGRGFIDTGAASTAVAVLPSVDLLPPVLQMVGYIVAYIVLIGPLNYIVLSRLNRREWAWFTIPLLIVAFSTVAWTVGFNLRGNDLVLSRLQVVQVYPETDTARVDQLVGVLSPRRDTYTMTVEEDQMLRVMPGLATGGFLQRNITQSTSEIVQRENFAAENISIDGGIFANFSLTGVTDAPAIGGSATITYAEAQRWQGVIRNDSDITLSDPVLLARNRYYALSASIEPGDVVSFDSSDLTVLRDGEDLLPLPSSLESSYELELGDLRTSRTEIFRSLQSSRIVQGDIDSDSRSTLQDDDRSEEAIRRDAFLRSFLRDQYNSQAIGDDLYVMGWGDALEANVEIEGASARDVTTSFYIVQLETTMEEPPGSQQITLEPDQFTWTILNRDLGEGGNEEMRIFSEGFIEMRFTPTPEAVLETVESMTVALDRSGRRGRDVLIELWDWSAQEWVSLGDTRPEVYDLNDPAQFVGPGNIVDARISLNIEIIGSADSTLVNNLRITQKGNF